ncbi:hypothetical protein FRC01_009381 [Tulasnella sp. 417]|nr:hypothetical protein FRC01_009381 [Tulasnella sp. 417]
MPHHTDSDSNNLWTFNHANIVPPRSGRRIKDAIQGDLVAEHRFYGTVMPADISHEQLKTLEPNQWLSADLCTFYCYEVGNSYLEGAPGRTEDLVVLHARTWDLGRWTKGYPRSARLPGATPVFEHKYIVFPGNDSDTHFFLCIIVNASDLLLERNPQGPVRTIVLILNSLRGLPPIDPGLKIQRILTCLAEGRQLREHELSNITVYQPLVVQQPNYYDCGLYPGHFLSVFLGAPEAYTAHCMGEMPFDGPAEVVWKHDQVKSARRWLKALVLAFMEIRQAALDFNTDIPLPRNM